MVNDLEEYLLRIAEKVEEEKEPLLKELTRYVVGEYGDMEAPIPRRMSTRFNPNLFYSGQEEHNWEIVKSGNITSLYFTYTGMSLTRRAYPGGFKVWREFAPKSQQKRRPTFRVLERDYAYYQETGEDPIADKKYAKHQWAIRGGLLTSKSKIIHDAQEYMLQIMNKVG